MLFVLVPLFLAGGGASVADLRCEYARDPLGLDVARPRLSWVIESERRGERQTAYRVLVAGSEEALAADRGDLWDSGEVRSDQSVHVEYVGKPLASRQRAFWKVRVWDREAQPSAWSPTARWEMGLLAPTDWVASWIGLPEGAGTSRLVADSPPATYLRKDFTLDRTVRCARAYASAKGLYVLSLNGRRVSEDVFRPGWTDYRDRIEYQTYDVTALVRRGANAVGVVLGDGWYAGHVGNWGRENWGRATRAAVQIEFEYADGTATRVVTDGSWKACTGPILASDLLMGETYDARLEKPGWDTPSFDDGGWRVPEVEVPIQVHEAPKGAWVLDLGQNMVGWARLRVQGPAGTVVRLRHAEMLNPDGSIYTANLRSARATDTYGNYLEVPTDCPQRDERLGWMGDAEVFARAACFNADVAGFLTKWLRDVRDTQSPAGAFPDVAPDRNENPSGALRTLYGRILSSWRIASGHFPWEVAVPPNTTATVRVPTSDPASVTEGGRPAAQAGGVTTIGPAVYEIGSGTYLFEAKP